jgi:glycosyltransferase involved in cell wall biosynthesis
MLKVVIVMPAYNEEKRIGRTLEAYCRFFSEKKKRKEIEDFEILVVINNTKDNTEGIVKAFQKKCKKIRYLNFKQGGKGFAIIQGFKDALKRRNDLIGFVDADMATPAFAFYELVKNIDGYAGVIASRYLKRSVIKPRQTLKRIFVSRIFNFMVRSLFFMPYKDTQLGAKLFKRKAIENIVNNLGTTKWAFDIDLLYNARKKGLKVKELPTVWQDVDGSKLNVERASIQMFFAVARLKILNSPFKVFWPVLRSIGGWIWRIVR